MTKDMEIARVTLLLTGSIEGMRAAFKMCCVVWHAAENRLLLFGPSRFVHFPIF